MHSLLHTLPLGSLNLEPWLIAIIVPIAGMIFAGLLIYWTLHFQHQQKLAWHETARVALEKGQPVPPMPGAPNVDYDATSTETALAKRERQQRNDLRAGLILAATGAGIFLMLRALVGAPVQYVGAIPGLIGVAMVLHALLDRMFTAKSR